MRTYIVRDAEEAQKVKRRRAGINGDPFEIIIDPVKIDLHTKLEKKWLSDRITSEKYYTQCAEHDMFLSEDGDHLILINIVELRERYFNTRDLFPEIPGLREKVLEIMDETISRKEKANG